MQPTSKILVALILMLWLCAPALGEIPQCGKARLWLNKGMLLHDNSDREIEYYQKAVRLCPSLISIYNRIGEIYKNRGDIRQARQAFIMAESEVSQANETDIETYKNQRNGNEEIPRTSAGNTISRNPQAIADNIDNNNQVTLGERSGQSSANRNDYACEEARKWLHMGFFLHDNSDNEIFFYQRAAELCRDLVPVYNRIGEIYRQRGDTELAERAYVIAQGNKDLESLLARFPLVTPQMDELYLRKDIIAQYQYYQPGDQVPLPGYYPTAGEEKIYEQLVIAPENINCSEARNWLHLGFFLHDSSDKEISYYQRAVAECTSLIPAYNRIGEIYRQRGDIYQSQHAVQLAQARVGAALGKTDKKETSGGPESLLTRKSNVGASKDILVDGPVYASIAQDELKPQGALTTTRFAKMPLDLNIRPDSCDEARKWYNEGLALRDNSDREASYYHKAVSLCPNYTEAFNQLGIVYKNQGKYQDAIEAFRKAKGKALLTDNKLLIIKPAAELGEIFRRQSKLKLAVDEFEDVLDIDPGSRVAQNQLEYLYKRMGKFDDITEPPLDLLTNATFSRISGMTLPKGTFLADLQYNHWVQRTRLTQDLFSEEIPLAGAPATTETDINVIVWGLRYGITNRFTAGIIQHTSFRTAHVPNNEIEAEATPQVSGIGDTVLLGKYLLWGVRQTNLSTYTQLSIPTGDENEMGEDIGVVRNMPLGSGSYDVTIGLAFSAGIDLEELHPSLTDMERLTFHSHTSYKFTDGIHVGDEFHLDLALSYPLLDYITYNLELNYRWRGETIRYQTLTTFQGRPATTGPTFDPVEAGSEQVETTYTDPGGQTLFFSPNLQFDLGNDYKLELGVQIPFIKPDLGMTEDLIYHLGLTKFMY